MKMKHLLAVAVFCQFLLVSTSVAAESSESNTPAWYKPLWHSSNVQMTAGKHYKTGGDEYQQIYGIESASGWVWGDLFFFVDHTAIDDSDDELYFEIHPRLSLSYLTGKDLSFGPVKDVFLAAEYNRDDNEFEALLYGGGLSLDVPGFSFLDANIYLRDDQDIDGETWQFSVAWGIPFSVCKADFLFSGFFDYAGEEGYAERNFLIEPRLVVDAGKIFDFPNHIYTGVEYKKWNNKYGIKGMDEEVTSFIAYYKF